MSCVSVLVLWWTDLSRLCPAFVPHAFKKVVGSSDSQRDHSREHAFSGEQNVVKY